MLKYTFENKNQELKSWIDPKDGSLNVQVADKTVSIPHEIGLEMITVLKSKQSHFLELERKKESQWNRLIQVVTGKDSIRTAFWSEA